MEKVGAEVEAQTEKAGKHLEAVDVFKPVKHPITLKFQELIYKIKTKKGSLYRKNIKSEENIILKGLTGMVKPGEMLAMLGPAGNDKTTVLTSPGGRFGQINGNITYNEKSFSKALKRYTGFVTQDDVLYPHLTVAETMIFTALLRPSNSLTQEEKVMRAEAVIAQLGLTKCENSIIGGPLLRGISGGQRKRVSTGQEMLKNPSLMFLDEPISGPDSTTTERKVSILWKLPNGRRTIVLTIHQPSSRLFYMFHKVLLLSEGNPLYFGEVSDAMYYFASIGISPRTLQNFFFF